MEPIATYRVRIYADVNRAHEYLCLIERDSLDEGTRVVALGTGDGDMSAWREARNNLASGGLACCND